MKTGFKDRTEVKDQNEKMKSPWDFTAPCYDERSSNFINAGTHYGVGHRQPVGHMNNVKNVVPELPRNRKKVNTLADDRAESRNLPINLIK